jgi:hypothetical protein
MLKNNFCYSISYPYFCHSRGMICPHTCHSQYSSCLTISYLWAYIAFSMAQCNLLVDTLEVFAHLASVPMHSMIGFPGLQSSITMVSAFLRFLSPVTQTSASCSRLMRLPALPCGEVSAPWPCKSLAMFCRQGSSAYLVELKQQLQMLRALAFQTIGMASVVLDQYDQLWLAETIRNLRHRSILS